MHRRHFLRATGVSIGLPFLEAMLPSSSKAIEAATSKPRMVAINVGLGLHSQNIIPTSAGPDYKLTPYLKPIEAFRDQFTLISGSSHPSVGGGHSAEKSFLTGAHHPGSTSFKNSVSLDQLAAQQIGNQTRYASLALSLTGRGLSWSRGGVEIPSETRPSQVFKKLFLEGKPKEKALQIQRLKDGQSILDSVMDKTKSMKKRLGSSDRAKLDQYLTAVREAEQRLIKGEQWEHKNKPKVDAKTPVDIQDRADVINKARLMYDIMHLALQTDSTRLITFFKNGINAVPKVKGVGQDYHNLSHHGKDPEKIKELTIIETAQMTAFAEFLNKLSESKEADSSLLDHTMVLFGSNLGNASNHNNRNLPILLAGGNFKHGQHLAFDQEDNYPLAKLYVSMLQKLGIETNSFAGITGTLQGLA
ncbi:MAG: DUF1552 domain-containing protein [Verrucomicrobiales bacterium]|nr:DUF1552 domain-containing protein [Verrucomicrobiales bacterium]